MLEVGSWKLEVGSWKLEGYAELVWRSLRQHLCASDTYRRREKHVTQFPHLPRSLGIPMNISDPKKALMISDPPEPGLFLSHRTQKILFTPNLSQPLFLPFTENNGNVCSPESENEYKTCQKRENFLIFACYKTEPVFVLE